MSTFEGQNVLDGLTIPSAVHDLPAPPGAANFGMFATDVGDVNADGVSDFLITAPGRDGPDPVAGSVYLYSGRTFEVLAVASDAFVGFGMAVARLEDRNGDGVHEIAIGSPNNGGGAVTIHSGADLSTLSTLANPGAMSFGRALGANKDIDVDGDGEQDVFVGASGVVYGISLASGAVLRTIEPPIGEAHATFGASVGLLTGLYGANAVVGAPGSPFGGVYWIRGGPSWQSGDALTVKGLSPGFSGQISVADSSAEWRVNEGGERVSYSLNAPYGTIRRTVISTAAGLEDGFAIGAAQDPVTGFGDTRVYASRLSNGTIAFSFSVTKPVQFSDQRQLSFFSESAIRDGFDGAVSWIGDVTGDGVDEFLSASPSEAGGSVRILSPLRAFIIPGQLEVVWSQRNGAVLWAKQNASALHGPATWPSFSLVDGKVALKLELAGYIDERIVDSTSSHDQWIGYTGPQSPGPVGVVIVVRNGVREYISEAAKSFVGPRPDLTNLSIIGLSDSGLAALQGVRLDNGSPAAWMLHVDGTLVHLWDGVVSAMNDSGVAVGSRAGAWAIRRNQDGSISSIMGLDAAHAISPSGEVIVGEAGGYAVMIYGSERHRLGRPGDLKAENQSFVFLSVDDTGHAIGNLGSVPWSPLPFTASRAGDFSLITAVGGGPTTTSDPVLAVDSRGRILTKLGFLRPTSDPERARARVGELLSMDTAGSGIRLATINSDGRLVIYSRKEGFPGWSARVSGTGAVAIESDDAVVTWTDHLDGKQYAVYIGRVGSSTRLQVFILNESLTPLVTNLVGPARSLTPFADADGRLHLVGVAEDGSLIDLVRTDAPVTSTDAWTLRSISSELTDQGLSTPDWIGHPSAFVTAWGAMNIVGVDADGQVIAVWKAPGMTLWRADNLTTNAGGPKLTGSLTTFVTSWQAMNIVGTDESGDAVAYWWAPGVGDNWVVSNLTENAGGSRRLVGDSITSFVTAWGGLNVVGRTSDGAVVALWWAPGMANWVESELSTAPPSGQPRFSGPLTATATAAGESIITGVLDTGDVAALFWMPGESWHFDNLTASL